MMEEIKVTVHLSVFIQIEEGRQHFGRPRHEEFRRDILRHCRRPAGDFGLRFHLRRLHFGVLIQKKITVHSCVIRIVELIDS